MKLEVKEKKDNKLLGRLEVKGKLTFDGATPSNLVVKDTLAVELKADKELVVIKHIYSKFSYQEADFLAYIYHSKENMEKMEVITKHLRKKTEKKEKPAEETKEKAPAEEKKPAPEKQPGEQ